MVTAGTVAVSGRLVVRAERTGEDTQLAHLIALVEQAQAEKSRGPAARRPDLRRVRPAGAGRLPRDAGRVAGGGQPGRAGVQRRAGRADHRLPVRPRAWPPRPPWSWPAAGARSWASSSRDTRRWRPPAVVDTVVLDKTGTITTGLMAATGVRPAPGDQPGGCCCAASARSSTPPGTRWAVAVSSRRRLPSWGPLPRAAGSGALPGLGASRCGRRPRGDRGPGGSCCATAAHDPRGPGRPVRRVGAGRPHASCWPAGTARPPARSRSPTPSSPRPRPRSPGCGPWACARCCSPGTASAAAVARRWRAADRRREVTRRSAAR